MGLYDRDYTQSGSRQQHYGSPQMRFSLPRITPVVKWLLIANVGIFVLSQIPRLGLLLENWFVVDARSWGAAALSDSLALSSTQISVRRRALPP